MNECILHAVPISEADKTHVQLTHPTDKWRTATDTYATQTHAPTIDIVFKAMKALEERWITRNEREHEEVNSLEVAVASVRI